MSNLLTNNCIGYMIPERMFNYGKGFYRVYEFIKLCY